jgi:hypothetical protein
MHGSTGGSWRRSALWQPIHGGPRETEGPEPGFAYGSPPRQLPTQPRPRSTVTPSDALATREGFGPYIAWRAAGRPLPVWRGHRAALPNRKEHLTLIIHATH